MSSDPNGSRPGADFELEEPMRWADGASDAPDGLFEALREARQFGPNTSQVASTAARLGINAAAVGGSTALSSWLAAAGAITVIAMGAVALLPPGESAAPASSVSRAVTHVAASKVEERVEQKEAVTTEGDVRALPEETALEEAAKAVAQVAAPRGTRPAAQVPSEVELLVQARAAWPSRPQAVLRLTERHRALYPNGALSQEREVLAIQALERLGRADDANGRARKFSEAYPNSAHRKKVEQTLEKE